MELPYLPPKHHQQQQAALVPLALLECDLDRFVPIAARGDTLDPQGHMGHLYTCLALAYCQMSHPSGASHSQTSLTPFVHHFFPWKTTLPILTSNLYPHQVCALGDLYPTTVTALDLDLTTIPHQHRSCSALCRE